MAPKHRLTKVFFLMLSVVSLSSIVLMAALWINNEFARSEENSRLTRENYLSSLENAISTETTRIAEYLSAQTSTNQVKFYVNIKNRVLEIHSMLDGLQMEGGDFLGTDESKNALLGMLTHLSLGGTRKGYFCFTADGKLLTGIKDRPWASPAEAQTNYVTNMGPFLDPAVMAQAIESVKIIGEGFFNIPLIDVSKQGEARPYPDDVPITFLKYHAGFGWVIGASEFYSDFKHVLGVELLSWIDNVPIPKQENILIFDYRGRVLSYRDPSLIGDNVFISDRGTGLMKVAVETIRGAKERSKGFLRFTLRPSGSSADQPGIECLAFFRVVPEWKWVVIDFVSIDELEETIKAQRKLLKENLRQNIYMVMAITLAILVVIFILSTIISRRAAASLSAFFNFFEKAATSSVEIDPSVQSFEEFARLAEAANSMIRERRQADRLLKESELRFRTVFNVSPEVITILDESGRLLEANSEFELYIKCPLAEAQGRSLGELMGISSREFTSLLNELTSSGQLLGRETIIADDKGAEVYLLIFAKQMTFLDQNLILWICLNVSDRRKIENEKAELLEKLLRSKTMESMGRMAASVAHELNNILSALIGYPELLLKDDQLTESQKNQIIEIMDAGHRATDVVSDLLTLSRGVATAKVVVDLNNLVSQVADDLAVQKAVAAAKNKVEIVSSLQSPALVKGSPAHLRKIILHLVQNAVEILEQTGGRVSVSTKAISLTENPGFLDNFIPGQYVSFQVADNGPGIAAGDLAKIFEPFYTKKSGSGRGLGLALVALSVREHGGGVDVRTSPAGTVFEVIFPATEGVTVKSKAARSKLRGQGQRVLVVDDVDIQRKLAQKMLKSLGYEPFAVSSGEAAVDYLKENDVELVILDMIMDPGINGRQTYEAILAFKPHQKAIIASGLAENEEVMRAQALGASYFVSKPYTLDDIAGAIHKALNPEFV
ncbi:MAG: cache domain-containing protein [Deltaproteobacteria bacterium]|jgi:PAS domain S-box-containing protein|nr:cache domain-containing protein [Deltaproteobacteria bacterium]